MHTTYILVIKYINSDYGETYTLKMGPFTNWMALDKIATLLARELNVSSIHVDLIIS